MTDIEYLEEKAAHIAGISTFIAHESDANPIDSNPTAIEPLVGKYTQGDLRNWGLDRNGNQIILDMDYKGGNVL